MTFTSCLLVHHSISPSLVQGYRIKCSWCIRVSSGSTKLHPVVEIFTWDAIACRASYGQCYKYQDRVPFKQFFGLAHVEFLCYTPLVFDYYYGSGEHGDWEM